jgi:hypothetical protein
MDMNQSHPYIPSGSTILDAWLQKSMPAILGQSTYGTAWPASFSGV